MKELIDALAANGFAKPERTLSYVIANTMQDAQYSPGAHANAKVLAKYEAQYGNMTVAEIRATHA